MALTDKITTKDVISRLRQIAGKQKISEQRRIKEKIKEQKEADPCKICGDAVNDIIDGSKKMIDHTKILGNMYRDRIFTTKIGQFTYSIEDIHAMIERDKYSIERGLERYNICCREGKLPSDERLKY